MAHAVAHTASVATQVAAGIPLPHHVAAEPSVATRVVDHYKSLGPQERHAIDYEIGTALHDHHYHEKMGYLIDYGNKPRPGCPYGNCGTNLGPHDVVGTTFYIACNMMLAFTGFFFVQVGQVPKHWRTSVSVAGLVTGIAFYNYCYMKDVWVETQMAPTQFRYTDWLITVPLQIVEFYFILKASGPVPSALGMRLFLCSLGMVFAGWLGETNVLAKLPAFMLGMAAWLYIVYETFSGEASTYAARIPKGNTAAQSAFNTLRTIVSLGWTIYPIGFAIAYLCYFDQPAGVLSAEAQGALNIIYNLADLINKGAFGLCCWSAAVSDVDRQY